MRKKNEQLLESVSKNAHEKRLNTGACTSLCVFKYSRKRKYTRTRCKTLENFFCNFFQFEYLPQSSTFVTVHVKKGWPDFVLVFWDPPEIRSIKDKYQQPILNSSVNFKLIVCNSLFRVYLSENK